jgi:CrcB protein
MARFKLGGLVLHHTPDWHFPLGTFAVNVLGCLAAGVLTGGIMRQDWFSADTRMFLFAGVLGGFTTFSAFGVETIALLRKGENTIAASYVVASVLCGLAALWLGMQAVPHRSP